MNWPNTLEVDGVEIGWNKPIYFIADIGANHDGDLERAVALIYECAARGANAAKFQHFRAETIVSDYGFRALGSRASHQKAWKKTIFEVYRDASINPDWTPILKDHCSKAGISFLTSPYDIDIVDEVDQYVSAYKIGSGDITWTEILEKIARKGKPCFLACGASTLDDVRRAITTIEAINTNLVLMQCNTNYTGDQKNLHFSNLEVLSTFKSLYPGIILGLSDHTPGHLTALGAVALGARVIEKHFTDDKGRDGPDHSFAMDPLDWAVMVEKCNDLVSALGSGEKVVEGNELETVILQRRALRAARDLAAGTQIGAKDLVALRPCPADALAPFNKNQLLGRVLNCSVPAGELLKWSDLD